MTEEKNHRTTIYKTLYGITNIRRTSLLYTTPILRLQSLKFRKRTVIPPDALVRSSATVKWGHYERPEMKRPKNQKAQNSKGLTSKGLNIRMAKTATPKIETAKRTGLLDCGATAHHLILVPV